MRMKKFIFIACFAVASPAWSTSFDCSKASTDIEKYICKDPELGQLDDIVAQNYKLLLGPEFALSEADKKDVKDRQKFWLTEQRSACRTRTCLLASYRDRIYSMCGGYETKAKTRCRTTEGVEEYHPPVTPVDTTPPPPDVQLDHVPFESQTGDSRIIITSLENGLILHRIDINRGNCMAIDYVKRRSLPKAVGWAGAQAGYLNYGDRVMEMAKKDNLTGCIVREYVVHTNMGVWTMSVQ